MRCICDRTCQVRIEGKARMFKTGEVHEFDECPEYFRPLGESLTTTKTTSGATDFDRISRDELLEVDGDVQDLKAYMKENYPEVGFAPNIGWDTLVFRYLDAREARVTIVDNTGKRKNTIVEVKAALDRAEADVDLASDLNDLDDLLGE